MQNHEIHSEPIREGVVPPEWDDYFMEIALTVAKRSTCKRHAIGAILVRDRRMLSTGYNGAPSGIGHCLDRGCLRDKLQIKSGTQHELCIGVHAEQNAVIQCALHGVSSAESTLYTTHQPCAVCTKILINAGVKRVVYLKPYPDELSRKLIKESGIKFRQWHPMVQKK